MTYMYICMTCGIHDSIPQKYKMFKGNEIVSHRRSMHMFAGILTWLLNSNTAVPHYQGYHICKKL